MKTRKIQSVELLRYRGERRSLLLIIGCLRWTYLSPRQLRALARACEAAAGEIESERRKK